MKNKQKMRMFQFCKNEVKGKIPFKRLVTLLVFCLFLTSCSSSQITLSNLLEEVNEEHKLVERKNIDFQEYLRKPTKSIRFDPYNSQFNMSEEKFDSQKSLTWEEMQEDIDYLFDFLHDSYALYDYFGGDEVFGKAKEAVIKECQLSESKTGEVLEQSFLKNLTFIKDAHFSLNQKYPAANTYPFFYRETGFVKTEDGYQTTDGKKVQSIEGYDNLDELMKRSVSADGDLVYYPVILQKCEDYQKTYDQQEYQTDKELIVCYQDGTKQTLKAEPFKLYVESTEGNTCALEKIDNIPILKIEQFNQIGNRKLNEYIDILKESPISILDLRSNGGGDINVAQGLMRRYAGENISDSMMMVNAWEGIQLEAANKEWVENENILIIIVGKYTVSAAESLVDMAYNLENTIIVGENTNGGMYGGSISNQLPNSKILVACATWQFYIPTSDNFEELCGFFPDIWVPADEAENLILQYIKKHQN